MNRFLGFLVMCVAIVGCMEEEKASFAKLQTSEVEPVDSSGQDLAAIESDSGADAVDAADADNIEIAAQDLSLIHI